MVYQLIEVEKKFKQDSRGARKTKISDWTAYSGMKIQSYNAFLQMLARNQDKLTPLPIVEVREETRQLFLEDRNLSPTDFILSFTKLTGCPSGQYSLSFSVEVSGKVLSDTLPFCDANTLAWNYTQKYSRGPDPKQLDDTLHTRAINVIIFKKTFFSKEEYTRVSIPLSALETNASISLPVNLAHKKDKPVLHVR